MTAYASKVDMLDRFGETELVELTDRSGSGTVNVTVLDQALADAGDEIDGYVGVHYSLPLPATPAVLTRMACDIARYRLYDLQAPQQITERYKDAVQFLKQVAAGLVTLGFPTDNRPAPTGAPSSASPGRTYTYDNISDYMNHNYGGR